MQTTGSSVLFLGVLVVGLFFCPAHAQEDVPVEFDDVARASSYDYIVVGVGASGSVAAARLANAGYQVLGIDGGPRSHRVLGGDDFVAAKFSTDAHGDIVLDIPWTRFDVPTFYPTFYTQPTPWKEYPAILNGAPISAGEMTSINLGGAGSHNGMHWNRWTKVNFDSYGVTGWSYDDVLPFYKKSENVTGTANQGSIYHGETGPIKITDAPTNQPYFESITPWVQACVNSGLPFNPDFNGAFRLGCGTTVYNIRRGVRSAAANEYLPSALRGGNLHLSLDSFVTKIIIERKHGQTRAVGVQYVQHGQNKTVYANKEIIITLSAVLTPKLLLLSGIGPASTLNALGIPVWVDNSNVGKNLRCNQITFGASWQYPGANIPNGFRVSDDATSYALNGTGPWSYTGNFANAFACSVNGCSDPDIYLSTAVGNGNAISYTIGTTKPQSVGNVTISSSDPFAPPIMNFPVFQNQSDLNSIVNGIKIFRRIMSLYPANVTFGAELAPGPTVVTDTQIADWVRSHSIFGGHWLGTARVGNLGDPAAVLDPQMRVLGVKGLRVGDTSALVRGNGWSHATAVMVGERVAAFVLADA